MLRNKKIVIVSHCVFNQNSVVYDLARAGGPMKCAYILMESGAGIMQLPCPEKTACGMGRPGMNVEQFEAIPGYHELCEKYAQAAISDIKDYLKYGYDILGLISIEESPTCSIGGKRGVLMQHLFRALETEKISIPYLEIPASGESDDFLNKVREMVKIP